MEVELATVEADLETVEAQLEEQRKFAEERDERIKDLAQRPITHRNRGHNQAQPRSIATEWVLGCQSVPLCH